MRPPPIGERCDAIIGQEPGRLSPRLVRCEHPATVTVDRSWSELWLCECCHTRTVTGNGS